METIYFDNQKKFIKASADYILKEALSAIEEKGFFTVAITGGSTPPPIYKRLASVSYKHKFPWGKTYFFIGDERLLSPDNPDSNIFMINQTLFLNNDIPSENKILPDVNMGNPEDVARNYELRIKDFFKTDKPIFDLILLGMGMDCHTASLFPDDVVWKHNNNLILSTSKPMGEPNVFRVSMGLPLLNQSKNILMLISGQSKRDVANELLKNMNDGKNPTGSPIPEIKNIGNFTWHIY